MLIKAEVERLDCDAQPLEGSSADMGSAISLG